MLVLVTQADGSARRFPWLSYALALLLVGAFMSSELGGAASRSQTDELQVEILSYFNEHPFVEVDPRFEYIVPGEYATELREAYFSERRQKGLPLLASSLAQRSQVEFDELLERCAEAVSQRPSTRYGVTAGDGFGANWFVYAAVHETQIALLISLVFLLCLGIPLEDGWGPILFGIFVAASVGAGGALSAALGTSASSGLVWTGAGGLVAAFLGATLIRSLPGAPRLFGAIPIPGWLMLPIWLGLEYGVIRQISSVDALPRDVLWVHALVFGFGIVVSTSLMLLGYERRALGRALEEKEVVSNPELERALRAREVGKNEIAHELLRKAYRSSPRNPDIALAYWDVARELGQASEAVDAVRLVLCGDLSAGNGAQAIRHWFALQDEGIEIKIEPAHAVRLGEALLDDGHPNDALEVLGSALADPATLPAALAQRVVRIARDLDPELTRQAATIALNDGRLEPAERQQLEALTEAVISETPSPSPAAQPAPSRSASDVETLDDFAAASADDSSQDSFLAGADALELDDDPGVGLLDEDEDPSLDLDPQALSIDALAQEVTDDTERRSSESWNDPGIIEDLSSELRDDLDDLDPDELEQAALDAGLLDDLDLPVDDTDSTETLPVAIGTNEDTVTEVNVAPAAPPSAAASQSSDDLRRAIFRLAIPLRIDAKGLVIEVAGGGKSRLRFDGIDAIAVAAVHGLATQPVLMVDLVLNWETAGEPLKVVRFRSDQFDPRRLVAGAPSPLDAIRTMLTDLLRQTRAKPLPNFDAVTGVPFAEFTMLSIYQREVLKVSPRKG